MHLVSGCRCEEHARSRTSRIDVPIFASGLLMSETGQSQRYRLNHSAMEARSWPAAGAVVQS